MIGLSITANIQCAGNIPVAFGNPFDGMGCIVWDSRQIVVDMALPIYRYDDCGLVHLNTGCSLPAFKMAHSYYFRKPAGTTYPVCLVHVPDNK